MNPPDDPTDPKTWLRRAQSSLILAEQGRSIVGVSLEDLCFHAQQAAEKALKAVCVKYNIEFPKTHSLVRLTDVLVENGISVPKRIRSADILSQYAVETRYPGVAERVTETEYTSALKLAAQVVSWAEREVTKN